MEKDIDGVFYPVPIARTNVMCTGLENAVSKCGFDGCTGNPDCDHFDDIFIYSSRKLLNLCSVTCFSNTSV